MRSDDLRTSFRDAKNRFGAQPQRTRWSVWIAIQAVVVVVLALLDTSLGVAAFVAFVAAWSRKVTDLRTRLGLQIALVVALLVAEPSAGVLIGIAFALTWVPEASRAWVLPTTVIALVF